MLCTRGLSVTKMNLSVSLPSPPTPQGYVCYKPAEQSACFLRRMDHQDLENIQLSFNASVHRVSRGVTFAEGWLDCGVMKGPQHHRASLL